MLKKYDVEVCRCCLGEHTETGECVVQQLKARIAAIATRVEASYTVETSLKELSSIVYELRQLSAVLLECWAK